MSSLQKKIDSFEREARERYNSAVCQLNNQKPASWFLSILNNSILPPLSQIGLEKELSKTLFQIAHTSWQRMGPSVSDCLWIHPSLTRNIREIRKGVQKSAEDKAWIEALLNQSDSAQGNELIKRSMAPDNLTSLLDNIYPSWIILPRAYSLLQENDGCCLISYLKYVNREKNPTFRKLIIKIVIEFLANYSLKFAKENQPSKAVAEVIFYGYAVMFWKNLQQPQQGYEELSVYKNFLNWAGMFLKRRISYSQTMERTFSEMTDIEKIIFPNNSRQDSDNCTDFEKNSFPIGLRHGNRGIVACCNSFNISEKYRQPFNHGRELSPTQTKSLTLLLHDIKNGYKHETNKTRESTLIFLERLKNSLLAPHPQHQPIGSNTPSKQMDFMNRRLWFVIDDFIQQQNQSSAKPTTGP